MSPLEIQIMLHYWCRTNDFVEADTEVNPDMVQKTIDRFCELELLRPVDPDNINQNGYTRHWETTDRGEAYVKGLQDLPLPRMVWIIDDA